MSSTWESTSELSGKKLLPAGTRNYTITSIRPELTERNNQRVLLIGLASEAGGGTHELPLECWKPSDPKMVELWEKIIKTWASRLGYTPSQPGMTMQQVAQEFTAYAPSLNGAVIELDVNHSDRQVTEGEHMGKTFTDAKVYINKLVSTQQHGGGVPIYEGSAAAATGSPTDFYVPGEAQPVAAGVSGYEPDPF